MKNLIESIKEAFDKIKLPIATGIAALALTIGASAQSVQTITLTNGLTTGTTNLIFTNAVYITGVTLTAGANNGGTNASVWLYDANTATNQYVLAGYTNTTYFKTNISSVFTNSAGMVQTNKYSGIYTRTNAVSAVTNTLPVIYAISTPPNSTAGSSTGLRLLTTKGLSYVQGNSISNAVMTIYYIPWP